MRILALDSTNPTGSMAVVEASGEDGRVLVQRAGDPARPQAERLPGDLLAVLTEARVALHDVDVLAVASGPGSFTGLRIGIACMQGLAAVLRRQIVAVSVLEAVAHQASRDLAVGQLVGVWVDARRRDVFAALYRVGPGRLFSRERLIEVEGPSVGPAAAVLERWTAGGDVPAVVAGDGAVLYGALLDKSVIVAAAVPLAGTIGAIAGASPIEDRIEPVGVRPLYVRRPDAEVAKDARDRLLARGTEG